MSFLPGRMAATEGAFFREQSKAAAKLLKEKMDPQKMASISPATNSHADTLPEILMHSLPSPPPGASPPAVNVKLPPSLGSSLAELSQSIMKRATKAGPPIGSTQWIRNDPIDLLSTSVPSETTFGPRRWSVELTPGSQPVPSTANAARLDAEPLVDPPTQEEVREGMISIAKAFGVASAIIFGGAAVGLSYLGYRLELHSLEDVKTKGREKMVPYSEAIRQWLKPTQQWAHQKGEKWKMEEAERHALGMEFAQSLGVKPGDQLKAKTKEHQTDRSSLEVSS